MTALRSSGESARRTAKSASVGAANEEIAGMSVFVSLIASVYQIPNRLFQHNFKRLKSHPEGWLCDARPFRHEVSWLPTFDVNAAYAGRFGAGQGSSQSVSRPLQYDPPTFVSLGRLVARSHPRALFMLHRSEHVSYPTEGNFPELSAGCTPVGARWASTQACNVGVALAGSVEEL